MNPRSSIIAFVVVASSIAVHGQIAQWTFEAAPPADLANSTDIGPLSADVGSGTATGHHASAASDWLTPPGNGSANALSVNTWSAGDYLQFAVSTQGGGGASRLEINWDHTSSGTGPRDFGLQYSTDGTSFTTLSSYSVLENVVVASPAPNARNDWRSSGARQSLYTFNADTGSVPGGLVGLDTVYFRLTDAGTVSANGGTVATSGTSRADNFTVSFAAVPEPEEYAAMFAAGLVAFAVVRRRWARQQ